MGNILEVRDYIKRNNIRFLFLNEFMEYHYHHISLVLNNKRLCTPKFKRLLYLALMHHAGKNQSLIKQLEELWVASK